MSESNLDDHPDVLIQLQMKDEHYFSILHRVYCICLFKPLCLVSVQSRSLWGWIPIILGTESLWTATIKMGSSDAATRGLVFAYHK